jgi:hypothetical protein
MYCLKNAIFNKQLDYLQALPLTTLQLADPTALQHTEINRLVIYRCALQ